MGTNASISTFIPGTTMSSGAVNAALNSINTAATYFFSAGSLTGIDRIRGNTSAPANFTNTLGALPNFAGGGADTGGFCFCGWNANTSSASIVVIDPGAGSGGIFWNFIIAQY